MGIHGDKSQQERDWVLNGSAFYIDDLYRLIVYIRQSRSVVDLFIYSDRV